MAFYGTDSISTNYNHINFDAEKNYFRTGDHDNFLDLVNLMAGENDDLAKHLEKCMDVSGLSSKGRGNKLTFLSRKFIDKALLVTRQCLVNKIVDEINRNGGNFGLEIDGSQDVSIQQQYSIVVRYINDEFQTVERTVLFLKVVETSGNSIFELLQTGLSAMGLQLSKIVGFSFDGGSNVRFTLNSCIRRLNGKCIYTWCLSHRYNLVHKSALSSCKL